MEKVDALLWGIGASLAVCFIAYVLWLKPVFVAAQKERRAAEDAEHRVNHEAQLKADELLLEAKRESIRTRERAEDEIREKALAAQRTEDRLCAKEETLELRRTQIEQREANLTLENRRLEEKEAGIGAHFQKIDAELLSISGLSADQALATYLGRIENEFRDVAQRRAREIESQVMVEADRKAKKVLLDVMQRTAVEYVTEATLAVIELPSEDMKGRIIGREGRNIRAFEQVTGVDLIVDETPEAVVISCFDPIRRETARLALMNLMVDGRIHPGRIEELYEKAQIEVSRTILEAGERAVERANVSGLDPRIVETMGKLRFRTSYAQNVLDHSVEVAKLCENLAAELGLNVEVAKRAGFLHDIGKALGLEYEGPHALTGMEFLKGRGEKDAILLAVGAHHHDIDPSSPEAMLVIIADSISAARPGARRENLDNYIKRLTALETLANSFEGVERSYAVQAGRDSRTKWLS
ncbi:ribonuclease Y [soil metagenome]